MKVTEVQGTKLHLVATTVDVSDAAAIATAIAGAETLACIQEIGDISLGTKAVTEYSCISSDSSFKSLGSVTLGNISPSLLFDAADTAGQNDLQDMWDNNTRRILIVELDDQITTNPTYITFEAAISAPSLGIAKDSAVMYNPTIEICSKPAMIEAT